MISRSLVLRSRHESGWALIVVLAAGIVSISLAMALVANRHQAMKLAGRQQKDQLAALDAQIRSEYAKTAVAQAIRNQVGGINLTLGSSGAADMDSVLKATSSGSTMIDGGGQEITPYQVSGQYGSVNVPLDLYTPQTVASNLFQTTLTTGTTASLRGLTDAADPLLGVQHVEVIWDNTTNKPITIPVQLQSTVDPNAESVFYVGQSASTNYALREVPLSIYSLYGSGNSSISPDQLAMGSDAGRIYVNGSLTVNGQVTASWPLTAQQGINTPPDGSASLTVGSTAQTLGQSGATVDQLQMAAGNQILTSGTQGAGVQVLPTSNFGDTSTTTNTALSQLGTQCELQVSYTDATDASGNISGLATVMDQATKVPIPDSNDPSTGPTFTYQVTQDSNAMNARWDQPNATSTPPPGYMAAIDPNTNARLMNKENQAPMQFIVLDYSRITGPAGLNPANQTFYIPGNPNDYALLIRGGVQDDGSGNLVGTVTKGFSVVTNLDIYVSGGLAPSPTATNTPAISLITSGKVHAAP